MGETPFNKSLRDVLVGLVEEVRALCKEVASTKETYAEKLKKGLSSLTSLPSIPLQSFTPSTTSTRSRKKQL